MNKHFKYICSAGAFALLMGTAIGCSEEEPIYMAPEFKLNEVSNIMRTTATFSGSISGDLSNIKEYGFQYSLSEDYTANLTENVVVGETLSSSSFDASVSGLEANERYYYRMYASTGASKVFSESEYFQTAASSAPLLTNLVVDSIGENVARFKCTVEDIGDEYLIEYGVGYKTMTDQAYIPIPSDSIIPGTNNTYFVEISGLEPATKYSFRPYAKNSTTADGSTGSREGYGTIVERQTESLLSADVTTTEIADGHIGINSIQVSGVLNSAVGSNGIINKCGFCWSENNMMPVITDDTLALDPVRVGETFSTTIKDLKPKTLYYVRAYATNTVNGVERVGYGEVYEVTTGGMKKPTVEQEYEEDENGGQTATYETTATSIHFKALITNYDANALVEKGLIWSETDGTITLEKAKENKTVLSLDIKTGGKSIDGTIENLKMGTRYFVRAYAVYRAEGFEEIGYCSGQSIRTNNFEAPNLESTEIKDVTRNSATLVGGMSSKGNATIKEKGFVISKHDDTYRPELTTKGVIIIKSDDDTFTEQVTNLEYQTSYAVRTYAIAELAERIDTVYAWYSYLRTSSLQGPQFKQLHAKTSSDSITVSTGLDALGDGTIVEKGFFWRLDTATTEFNLPNSEGFIIGEGDNDEFSAIITGLSFDRRYNVGSYVKNYVDGDTLVSYGNSTRQYISFQHPDVSMTNIYGRENTIVCTAKVNSQGGGKIVERGFVWRPDSVNIDFDIEHCDHARAEGDDEEFTYTITGLGFHTGYHVKWYVKSVAGKDTITTEQGGYYHVGTGGVTTPELNDIEYVTNALSSITVKSGLKILGMGQITEKGFIWIKDPDDGNWKNPRFGEDDPNDPHNDGHDGSKAVTDGTNEDFSLEITGLTKNTRYYVCAYAKMNYEGEEYISYSESGCWGTQDYEMPYFNRMNVPDDSRGFSTAVLKTSFNHLGNVQINKKGFVVHLSSITGEPSLNNKLYQLNVEGDEFVATLKGLKHGTQYSVRAFVTCQMGEAEETTYSGTEYFSTKSPQATRFNNLNYVSDSTTVSSLYFTCGIGETGDGTLVEKGFIWKQRPENSDSYWQHPSFEDDATNENDGNTGYQAIESDSIQSYSYKMTGLKAATTYFVRSYAKMKVEDSTYVYYSDISDPTTSSVKSTEMKNIEYVSSSLSSITVKSGVQSRGNGTLVERGFIWIEDPDTDDYWKYPQFGEDDPNDPHNDGYGGYKAVTDGTDEEFSLEITGLNKNKYYFIRSYVKMNYDGKEYISYSGNTGHWATQDYSMPNFGNMTVNHDSIGFSTALLQSTFNSLGNLEIVKKGFVLHLAETTSEPTLNNKLYQLDVEGDTLKAKVTGLKHNTRYSVRAFATCKAGENEETVYSGNRTFTTDRPEDVRFNHLVHVGDSTTLNTLYYTCGIAEVPDGEVIEKGFIWKERPINDHSWQNPSFEDRADVDNDGYTGYQTVESDSLQSYSYKMTGLKPSTTYYVRSYAKVKVEDVEYIYYTDASGASTRELSVDMSFEAALDSCVVSGTVGELPEGVEEFGVCYSSDDSMNIDKMTDTLKAVKADDFDESRAWSVTLKDLDANHQYKVGFYFILDGKEIRLTGEWWFTTKRAPSIGDNVSPGKTGDE